MTTAARIARLTLTSFRSYHSASFAIGDRPVVLVGPNGAGKTNVLEAISFLAPGRGLRRARLEEVAYSEGHGTRVYALERALRSRKRLLENPSPDPHWLDATEHETAELAVAVAAARAETVRRLAAVLAERQAPDAAFPSAEIALEGWMETLLLSHPAAEVEDRYRAVLKKNRGRDAAAGRTLDGPHRTDLAVVYAPKGIAARDASTGEQKAMLIGLVLAHAGLVAGMTGTAPVILLDEVVAHLDPARRGALHDALDRLGAQIWMTGADPDAFADIAARAQVLSVRRATEP